MMKMNRNRRLTVIFPLILSASPALIDNAQGQLDEIVRLVDVDVTCSGIACDGRSWSTAYPTLQDALDDARNPMTTPPIEFIWVAEGTYYPDEGGGHANNDRTETFLLPELPDGFRIMGGFDGCEPLTLDGQNSRNPFRSVTILSGAIGGSGNTYHVVTSLANTQSTVLDGFTIRDGDARDAPAATIAPCPPCIQIARPRVGGGMLIVPLAGGANVAAPTVVRCVFTSNRAEDGAGVYFTEGGTDNRATFYNCRFEGNIADQHGGGFLYDNAAGDCGVPGGVSVAALPDVPAFYNTLFTNNLAGVDPPPSIDGGGGGIYINRDGKVVVENCTFRGNSAGNDQGQAIHLETCDIGSGPGLIEMTSSIIWGNGTPAVVGNLMATYTDSEGFIPPFGVGNINEDPLFVSGSSRIDCNDSPCVDTGNPSDSVLPHDFLDLDQDDCPDGPVPDLDLKDRVTGFDSISGTPRVDMGAFETRKIDVAVCRADIAPPPSLPCQTAGNGVVNVDDLLAVINGWGICQSWPNQCRQILHSTLTGVVGKSMSMICS